ncbi:thrombospondin related adhesive protein [Cryptosporidium ubiquitum]|uniref:Thrombospondin related adhesive protein n=1 Tax=Cryptosporidium ubiquitum TaxID=857276 RepID=A0A1J4ML78_9CRYT|nr:thrombospondin related adhesive protein [Cryptosporidium ubiquitum]OII74791.1 thrombospondin related adhesive protein [Cryptosporidium ubiquitum]
MFKMKRLILNLIFFQIYITQKFVLCSKLVHYSVGGHASTSRVKGRSSNDYQVSGLNGYACPKFDKDVKGFACFGMNTAYTVKKNSWQECANQCYWSRFTILGNCQKSLYNSNNQDCYIKNGDTACEKDSGGMIFLNRQSYMIGECATTCTVSGWSEWTPCSGVCGEMRSRSRSVKSQPKYGEYCPNLIEYSNCPVASKCPEDCPQYGVSILGWGCQFESTFSFNKNLFVTYEEDWKGCLSTCKQDPLCVAWSYNATLSEGPDSVGFSREYRPCYTHRFASGCHVLAPGWVSGNKNTRESDCETGSCIHNEWSSWSKCSDPCSNTETMSRNRTVKSVTQNWATVPCRDETQYQLCSEDPQSIATCTTCLVSQWTAWSICSTTCGEGVRTRTRNITKPPQNGNNSTCPELIEEESCNKDLECLNACEVGKWSDWSPCSVTCGSGTTVRNREVKGSNCTESAIESKNCNLSNCGDNSQSCTAVMSVWSEWSVCSEKCDQGLVRRYRDFDFSKIGVFGYDPPGTAEEQKKVRETCKDTPTLEEEPCTSGTACTPGCKYTEWGSWSDCDCSGEQTRKRVVTFPEGVIDAICQNSTDARLCSKPEGCTETAPDSGNASLAIAIGLPIGILGLCIIAGSLFLIGGGNEQEEDETNYQYFDQSSDVLDQDSEYVQEIGPENQNWAS